MKLSVFGLMLMLFLATSCDKEVITSTNDNESGILWSKKLTDETDYIFTNTQFPYFNSTVVFGGTKNNHGYVVGLDIETGEQKWEYINDDISVSSGINMATIYQSGAKSYLFDSPKNHYFLDVEEGITTSFETELNFPRGEVGMGNKLFKTVVNEDGSGVFYHCIVKNDLVDQGEFEEVFCPEYNFEHVYATGYYGYTSGRDAYIKDGDTMMVIGILDATEVESVLNSYWAVFNLSKNIWEVPKRRIFEDSNWNIGAVKENNGLFYFMGAARRFECWDSESDSMVWSKDFAGKFIFNEEHDLLILESNQSNEMYGLNPETGQEYWKASVTANSPLHYQDDILYFIGAGTGYLHALNITNGNEVWRIASPDIGNDDQATWTWQINGIPAQNGEKGKIFASSYLTGYCFEAVN